MRSSSEYAGRWLSQKECVVSLARYMVFLFLAGCRPEQRADHGHFVDRMRGVWVGIDLDRCWQTSRVPERRPMGGTRVSGRNPDPLLGES